MACADHTEILKALKGEQKNFPVNDFKLTTHGEGGIQKR